MYKVYFEIWRGFSNPTYHPAGTFNNIDEAIDCASKCYGYVQEGNRIIKDYRKR